MTFFQSLKNLPFFPSFNYSYLRNNPSVSKIYVIRFNKILYFIVTYTVPLRFLWFVSLFTSWTVQSSCSKEDKRERLTHGELGVEGNNKLRNLREVLVSFGDLMSSDVVRLEDNRLWYRLLRRRMSPPYSSSFFSLIQRQKSPSKVSKTKTIILFGLQVSWGRSFFVYCYYMSNTLFRKF